MIFIAQRSGSAPLPANPSPHDLPTFFISGCEEASANGLYHSLRDSLAFHHEHAPFSVLGRRLGLSGSAVHWRLVHTGSNEVPGCALYRKHIVCSRRLDWLPGGQILMTCDQAEYLGTPPTSGWVVSGSELCPASNTLVLALLTPEHSSSDYCNSSEHARVAMPSSPQWVTARGASPPQEFVVPPELPAAVQLPPIAVDWDSRTPRHDGVSVACAGNKCLCLSFRHLLVLWLPWLFPCLQSTLSSGNSARSDPSSRRHQQHVGRALEAVSPDEGREWGKSLLASRRQRALATAGTRVNTVLVDSPVRTAQ